MHSTVFCITSEKQKLSPWTILVRVLQFGNSHRHLIQIKLKFPMKYELWLAAKLRLWSLACTNSQEQLRSGEGKSKISKLQRRPARSKRKVPNKAHWESKLFLANFSTCFRVFIVNGKVLQFFRRKLNCHLKIAFDDAESTKIPLKEKKFRWVSL